MSAPSGFNPNASMLPDPGPSAAPIQVMKGGGNAAEALSKAPAGAGAGAAGIPSTGDNFTPEELAELTKYQLHPEGVIYNDIDLPTKRAFLEQLKDTTRCRRTTGNSIVLGKECWAIAKVIRALLRAKITKGNANHVEPATPGNAGGTPAPGRLTRGTGSRRLVPSAGDADDADDADNTPALPGGTGDAGGTPAPLPAPGGTGDAGGTPAPLPAPGGTPALPGGTGGTPAAPLPLGTGDPLVGPPVNVTTPPQQPEPSLEDLLAEAEAYYGDRPSPCGLIDPGNQLEELLQAAERYYGDRPSPCGPFAAAEEAGAGAGEGTANTATRAAAEAAAATSASNAATAAGATGGIAAAEAAWAAGNKNNASVNEETRDTPRTLEELDKWIANTYKSKLGEEKIVEEPANYMKPLTEGLNYEIMNKLIKKDVWVPIKTQGGGHCLMHALLLATCPSYRRLSHTDRETAGMEYRTTEFYKLFTPEEYQKMPRPEGFPDPTSAKGREDIRLEQIFVKDDNTDPELPKAQKKISKGSNFLVDTHQQVFSWIFKVNIFNILKISEKNFTYSYTFPDNNTINNTYPWIFIYNTQNAHFSAIKIKRLDTFILNNNKFHELYDPVLGDYFKNSEFYNEFNELKREIKQSIKYSISANTNMTLFEESLGPLLHSENPADLSERFDNVIQVYNLQKNPIVEKYKHNIAALTKKFNTLSTVYERNNYSNNESEGNSGSVRSRSNSGTSNFANSSENRGEFGNEENSGSESGSNNGASQFGSNSENEENNGASNFGSNSGSVSSRKARRSAYTFIKRTRRRRNAKQSRKQRK